MACKQCGGALHFQNGVAVCQSCGATVAQDSFYDSVEVYICYQESDEAGRRTKDSLIAQDVYHRLEGANIRTFYERISADGLSGDDLALVRSAAIGRAKAIVVVAASVEHFEQLADTYGAAFTGKTVIPFCVDVKPDAIPKSLSKIQAISYSTIGWEKDLTRGLYNLLGRADEVDAQALYHRHRRMKRILLGAGIALLLVVASVAVWLFVDSRSADPSPEPPTQQELYDQAVALLDEGKLMDSLELLLSIPEHRDSASKVQQIYARYEGYYQAGNVGIHLAIAEDARADVEITVLDGEGAVRIVESAKLETNTIDCEYLDNRNQAGTLRVVLENEGVRLVIRRGEPAEQTETFFKLSEKSDQPIVTITAELLLGFVKSKATFSSLTAQGYELEFVENMCSFEFPSDDNALYRIKDTDVYLSMIRFYFDGNDEHWAKEQYVVAVAAPAEILAPSLVGKRSEPVVENNVIYCPNAYLHHYSGAHFETDYFGTDRVISESTVIGMAVKTSVLQYEWETLLWSVRG